MERFFKKLFSNRLFIALLGILNLAGSVYFMQNGLDQLAEVRQMERLPETPTAALAQGPYAVAGTVSMKSTKYITPYSETQAVYYRYKLEEEYRDSDGDLRTRTLASGERGGPFLLKDPSGEVTINPGSNLSTIDWAIARTHYQRKGDRIYSEWALKPDDGARVIGMYVPGDMSVPGERQIGFAGLQAFSLPALISGRSLDVDGGDRLFGAALRISSASGLLALGIALLLIAVKIHRFWVYVLVLSVVVTGTLSTLGVAKLKMEWTSVAELYLIRFEQLRAQPDNPLLLADITALKQLIDRSTDGWLDQWMFRRLVENRLSLPELAPQTAAMAQRIVNSQPHSRYQHVWLGWGAVAGSLLLALFLLRHAIRNVRFKRLVEHLPVSSSQGLSFGLSELKGRVEVNDAYPAVIAPLKKADCVAYDYTVEERRGSGKKARWVTIEHLTKEVPFWLEDREGRALVYPEGADIEYPQHYSERHGKLRYTVRWLDTLAHVYCLGFAGLDRRQPDRLAIQQDEGQPFFITARTEQEIILSRGASGFVVTALSLGLFLFAATALLATDGNFSPDNLLLSSLAVPLVLCVYIGVLHYNDVIFLKSRVDRARANIDTILKQRHDLWPFLERAVKGAFAHEKELLQAITSLRTRGFSTQHAPQALNKLIQQEQQVANAVRIRLENYPDLKGNAVVMQFMDAMTETENYLALLRSSYSDGVMIYNTRIQSFPDLLLAALFRFRPAPGFPSVR